MSRPIIILGAGGAVYDILDLIDAINRHKETWSMAGFLDDNRPAESLFAGHRVLGPLSSAPTYQDYSFILSIGRDKSFQCRPGVIAATGLSRECFPTLVHPTAIVSSRARIGLGTYINAGVSVGGGAVIGDHVCLCPGTIIGHDATIGDYSIVAPGAIISGFVQLQENCYIGTHAVIREYTLVGEQALVGMGAVVLNEVEPKTTVAGNPARVLNALSPRDQSSRLE